MGAPGSDDGQFITPADIAVDKAGNLYVVDAGNNRVQKFDSNGKFITKWGTAGSGDGQFSAPVGIAIDSSGNVYVSDNNRVQKFDSNGKFITNWTVSSPFGIAVDSGGKVYVIDQNMAGYRFIAWHHRHRQMFLNDITNYKIGGKLVPFVSVTVFWLLTDLYNKIRGVVIQNFLNCSIVYQIRTNFKNRYRFNSIGHCDIRRSRRGAGHDGRRARGFGPHGISGGQRERSAGRPQESEM